MKKNFLVYQLHFFNFPFLWIISKFHNVYIFKYKNLFFLRKKIFHTFPQSITHDQWVSTKERSHQDFKTYFEKKILDRSFSSFGINETNIFQHLSLEFDQCNYFLACSNFLGPNFVILKSYPHYFFNLTTKTPCSFFYFLDFLYYYIEAIALVFKNFIWISQALYKNINLESFEIISSGHASNEFPSTDQDLNFSWLVQNKILESNKILYILTGSPSAQQKSFLLKNNINWISKRDIILTLSLKDKIYLSIQNWAFVFPCNDFYLHFLKVKIQSDQIIWKNFLKVYSPKKIIFSLSEAYPEPSFVPLCKKLHIQSVCWFYGTAEFNYTYYYKNLQDRDLRLSIIETDHILLWNEEIKNLLIQKNIYSSNSKFYVIGPMVCGNYSFLSSSSSHHFSNQNINIAIYDLTAFTLKYRYHFNISPSDQNELQEAFYEMLISLFHQFPMINFLVKTKRDEKNNPMYCSIRRKDEFLNLSEDRIKLLSQNSDPLTPLSNCQLVISSPFTSASLMATDLGFHGIYYSPAPLYTNLERVNNLTYSSTEDIASLIRKIIADPRQSFKKVHAENVLLQLKNYFKENS